MPDSDEGNAFIPVKWTGEVIVVKAAEITQTVAANPEPNQGSAVTLAQAKQPHPKEIEVLPELWQKLQFANGAVQQALSPFSTSPDFDNMSEADTEAVIQSMNISALEKDKLKKAANKHKAFYNLQQWMKINHAEAMCQDLKNAYYLNKIFIEPKLQVQFEELIDLLFGNQIHAKVDHEAQLVGARLPVRDLKDPKPNIQKIEGMIQKRLGFEA